MAFCGACGSQVADGAAFCPACGKPTNVPAGTTAAPGVASAGAPVTASPAVNVGGLQDNVAGMLAYVTIVPAIVFLVTAPYNRNRFVRFHSFQSIFFCIAWIILWTALHFIVVIPFFGWATVFLWPLVGLAGLIIWVILLLKANQGQMYKLPVIGDLAEQQANAM